ncbi:hypothetical protein CDO26_34620 (plasmid) [Sinorhizobium meliloti]|nr:hypothetical protein CDO26_34620 [Sinorhizobium meliloti]
MLIDNLLPLSSSNRRLLPETVSICVDSLELRGKFESDLLICNLHATDNDIGSVPMSIQVPFG